MTFPLSESVESQAAVTLTDPRDLYPQPPFPDQSQSPPGLTKEMDPTPDHGEKSYVGAGKLRGLSAIITGGDSGIGRAAAIAYAREGADVMISYLNEDRDAESVAELIKQEGGKIALHRGDLGAPDMAEHLIDAALREFGKLDILVNNAAFQSTGDDAEDFSNEEFEKTFRTNVFAPFYLSKAALEYLPAGGSIINTVSIQAFRPSPQLLAYAATKSALTSLTKGFAKLAIERGVRVNGVAPGPVWTPFIPTTMPTEKTAKFGGHTLFGRPAQPAELAPLYVWLASPEASYVTGEVYGATGGSTPL
ncbi:SDR family oxidoreductase [Botrimarina mediterranea]|uniref:Putative oxidoreductase YghA n=1 Tax=Botrimarina mediterranea TaxID=2528022 RepID=A0A518K5U9_9BACT|nr:SDR family oxidoreductase [Botrimarina mediterranea]QDV73169.1 putative oxidoreductase YghA [Botrimarina mediterranea]